VSYLVLARKWRPQNFADLVGQEHVRRTLENAIAQGRVAHAFLFTGVRGVGKTTSARILAKALNCVQGPTGSPCLVCPACVEIAAGADVDVQEIDGASYGGINEVRDLQAGLPYLPSRDRFKIYIVDEVHMLSTAAWNAFLKTLEEPPPHVKFIFATTEVNKVPITILSRCQRYDFKMISATTIGARVKYVLEQEKIEADDSAISLVARQAAGSMRDAMSLLDQAIAWGGTKLIGEEVARVLGVASRGVLHDLSAALVDGRAEDCLRIVAQLVENGYDLTHAARDLLAHLRDLVVAKVCTDTAQLLDMADSERQATVELASRAEADDLVRLHQGFSRSFDDIIRSPSPRAGLEMILVRLARRPVLVPLDELMGKLADLERRLGGGGGSPPQGQRGGAGRPPSPQGRPGSPPARASAPTPSATPVSQPTALSVVSSQPAPPVALAPPNAMAAAGPPSNGLSQRDNLATAIAPHDEPIAQARPWVVPAPASPPSTVSAAALAPAPSSAPPPAAPAASPPAAPQALGPVQAPMPSPDTPAPLVAVVEPPPVVAVVAPPPRPVAPAPIPTPPSPPQPTWQEVLAAPSRNGSTPSLPRPQLQPPPSDSPAEPPGPPTSVTRPAPRPGVPQQRGARTMQTALGHDPSQPLPLPPEGVDFEVWSAIVARVRTERPSLGSALEFAAPLQLGPAGLVLGFPPGSFVTAQASEPKHAELLATAAREILGPDATVSFELSEASRAALTLSKIKAVEQYKRREEARRKVTEHPLVQAAIELLGAELRDVKIVEEEGRSATAERGKLVADIATPPFRPAPSVMMVSVDSALYDVIRSVFHPFPVLRVAHARAASERMLTTHPLVVVFVSRPTAKDLALVGEIAGSIGAELVIAEDYPELELLQEHLAMAMVAVQRKRGRSRQSGPAGG
jgi:DNA polymerase III subunit gamma/tau